MRENKLWKIETGNSVLPATRVAVRFVLALMSLLVLGWAFPGSKTASGQDWLTEDHEILFKDIVSKVDPSVVRIQLLGGLERVGETFVGSAATTGVVIREDGLILTSAFAFAQDPSSILVLLAGGERLSAKVVAKDRARHLVLLKVEPKSPLTIPKFASRETVEVGEWIVCVGKSITADQTSSNYGVVSATDRIQGKAFQVDAKTSPNNYGGPVLDIDGNVIGIVTPLSPEQSTDVAGHEWYDSGIGFAVPVSDVLNKIDILSSGTDLASGILGVNVLAKNSFQGPITISGVPAKSPAREAGILPGDVLESVDGNTIEWQNQLKHVLGKKYAGDKVQVRVLRDKKPLDFSVQLVEKIEPFLLGFVGIIPQEGAADKPGVFIRQVLEGQPAQVAGLARGDQIVTINGKPTPDLASLEGELAAFEVGAELEVGISRGGASQSVKIKLAPFYNGMTPSLEPTLFAGEVAKAGLGLGEIKLEQFANRCDRYVGSTYSPQVAVPLVVWLYEPKKTTPAEFESSWKDVADKYGLIVISPRTVDDGRWNRSDVEMINSFVQQAQKEYSIDKRRVILVGEKTGGAVALLAGLSEQHPARGVATINVALNGRLKWPEVDPINRLQFLMVSDEKGFDDLNKRLEPVRATKLPIETVKRTGDDLTATLDQIAQWAETLNRL